MNTTVQQNQNIVEEIQSKLCYDSTHQTRLVIGRILHVMRDQLLMIDQANKLMQTLSPDLQVIFISAWRHHRAKSSSINHLDQYILKVMEEDRSKKQHVFHSEIEALRATLIVLSALDQQIDLYNYLPSLLYRELKEAYMDYAA